MESIQLEFARLQKGRSMDDLAIMTSVPDMCVYLPSDHLQTEQVVRALLQNEKPAYVRVGRNVAKEVYGEDKVLFHMDRATVLHEGNDATIIACGELVKAAEEVACILKEQGIHVRVLDMYCLKPIDAVAVEKAAKETRGIITVEPQPHHSRLGCTVSRIAAEISSIKVIRLSFPDPTASNDKAEQQFDHRLRNETIAAAVMELI
ncbi:transketolase C-terminal domain-containing protein [Anaerosinus massiliensis]|uniref:transketolase C-terminal domain-containing protein n=1 Tax=Massilibacillus massiliensis TaxID=1806837 RepID=UPI0018FEB31B|nr:transketolase C-terminal domain-containing protein [Massilibacillus massiliensis]